MNSKKIHITEDTKEPILIENFEEIEIKVEPNVKATIIEKNSSESEFLSNTKIKLEENSELEYLVIQNNRSLNQEKRNSTLKKGAKINWLISQFGSTQSECEIKNHLIGENAEANIKFLFYSNEGQKFNFKTANIFDAKNCTGKMDIRGIGSGKSKSRFEGLIKITKNGNGTDSYLGQKTLLLDKSAKVEAFPSLEIDTDNVKAGHGASISNLDQENLFYLMSRGLSKSLARKITIEGFFKSLLNEVSYTDIIKEIEDLILQKNS